MRRFRIVDRDPVIVLLALAARTENRARGLLSLAERIESDFTEPRQDHRVLPPRTARPLTPMWRRPTSEGPGLAGPACRGNQEARL